MAGQHNDSSQMKAVLQPDDHSHKCRKEKHEHEGARCRKDSVGQAASCTSTTSAPVVSQVVQSGSPGAESLRQPGVGGQLWTQSENNALSCCSLDDLRRLPQCTSKLGLLSPTRTHNILIDVNAFNKAASLVPHRGRDTWSSNFVKMPCSTGSYTIVKTGLLKQEKKVKRWDEISKYLTRLARKSMVTVNEVEETIIKYNPKYKGHWSFDGLSIFHKRVPETENYFSQLFPKIAELASMLPDYVKTGIPLLQSGYSSTITLSQTQISCLLANAFFCTFPHRNTTNPRSEYGNYPTINFTSLFKDWSERKQEKLRAIMHYFKVATEKKLSGLVTFERRCLKDTDIPNWRRSKETMPNMHVTSRGTIETDGIGMLQVDFASSWIGGGVLSSGLVQEEILFLINPELIVSRLFTEKLEDNECLIITGSEQFSVYSGFSDSFEWAGPHEDNLPRDQWTRKQRQILAIDALHFKHKREQYKMRLVTRELNKAYCGFMRSGNDEPDIATGKWGCGAFNGDPQLKAVIQLMAAAKARRGLAFFTFGDEQLKRDLEQIYCLLRTEGTTVEKLYKLLEDFCDAAYGSSHVELFEFIRNALKHSRSLL